MYTKERRRDTVARWTVRKTERNSDTARDEEGDGEMSKQGKRKGEKDEGAGRKSESKHECGHRCTQENTFSIKGVCVCLRAWRHVKVEGDKRGIFKVQDLPWEPAEGICSFPSLRSVFNTQNQRDSCWSLDLLIAHSINNCYVSIIRMHMQGYTHAPMTNLDRPKSHVPITDREQRSGRTRLKSYFSKVWSKRIQISWIIKGIV